MNRKVFFLWGPVFSMALLLGMAGLLRVYLAETAEVLVAELTGAGAEIGKMDVGWFPPSVALHDLKLDSGSERIEAPRIDLYPDLSQIFAGEITLDRAVLDQPLIRAALKSSSGDGLDPYLLPKSISIRNASFVVASKGMPSTPVAFSAEIEKGGSGFALVVKNASIPEFGLTFRGHVDVASMAPMKMSIDAQAGEFNPSALIGFLRRFEYLGETELTMFADTKLIFAENFRFDFNAHSREVAFSAQSVVVDGSKLDQFATSVDAKGGWSIACNAGSLDAAQMMALAKAHPDGSKALFDGLEAMGLKSVAAEGVVSLKDVQVQSRGGAAKPSGVLALATPSLKVNLLSMQGESQRMTLNNFDGAVTIRNGEPTVSINRLDLASSAGGEGVISGEAPIPFTLAGTRFQAEARQLNWFETEFNGKVGKKAGRQIDFDLLVRKGSTTVEAKGGARNEFSGSNRWAMMLDNLVLKTITEAEPGDSAAQPFDFGFVRDGTLSGKIAVRRLQYNDMPVVRDMSAKVTSIKGQTTIKGRGRVCLMKVNIEAALSPDSVASNISVTGNGVQLPGVMGCFVDELPVYLRGRLTLQANLFMQGNYGQELKDSVQGDVVVRLRDLNVLKLTNLDKRLGFFLEILNAVGMEPDKGDTLTFRDGIVSASVKGDTVSLKAVRFGGGKVSVVGKGDFGIKDKRLLLDAHVSTPFGVNEDISIEKVLSEDDVS